MWRVLGKNGLIKIIAAATALAVASLAVSGITPDSAGAWVYASKLTGVTLLILTLLGTWLWRILWTWKKIPLVIRNWLNENICPDLNGTWEGELRSNFKLDRPGGELDSPVAAKVTIKANWFAIRIELEAKRSKPDKNGEIYSKSYSRFTFLEKNKEEDAFLFWYIYFTKTPRPMATDQNSHQGAALLRVEWEDHEPVLKGHYWTDRCWSGCPDNNNPNTVVKNTAGQAEFRRISQ
ncbi:MAG: hypothetical protein GY862_36715 [Gammaproteobacteria bacterium]|nr:hypothetical protein [Gammaproteobacteria bacterium]